MRRNIRGELPKPASEQICVIRTFWASLAFLLSIQKPSERESSLIGVVILTWVGKCDQLRFSPEHHSTPTYPVVQAAISVFTETPS